MDYRSIDSRFDYALLLVDSVHVHAKDTVHLHEKLDALVPEA